MVGSRTQTIPARTVTRVVAGLRLLGVDVDQVLARVGLGAELLTELDGEVPASVLIQLWDAAVATSGESGLGLRLAERVRPETYDVFGGLVSSSATLGEALLRASRLIRLVAKSVHLKLHLDGDSASVTLEAVYPMHREAVEFMIGATYVIGKTITGGADSLREVHFRHSAPPDTSHHQRIFGAPIRFDAPSDALVIESRALLLPLVRQDRELVSALEREAEALLAALPDREGVIPAVKAALTLELRGGDPTVERVGARLGLHPKTLARQLQDEGTTFREVLDDVRLRLAEGYLERPNLSVGEVAFLLGYSEKSAFNRAYRRWTGHPPRAGRREKV